MQSKTDVVQEQNFLNTLGTIATAYQEISVMKMKETRSTIEQARGFVAQLKEVFDSLRFSYHILKKREDQLKTKDTAKVLITANSRFHGDILRRIFNTFLKDSDIKGDIFVVGRIGKDFIQEYNSDLEYQFFEIPDNNIRVNDLKPLLYELIQYKTIHVYYAQFKTVIEQDIIATEIPSIYKLLEDEEQEEQNTKEKGTVPMYLFEPSGEEIAEFLNDNVTVSLMRQTLYETQLARYASRIKAMDALLSNIEDEMKFLKREKLKIQRDLNNKKQQERLSGIYLWGK
ncbi:F0F1 ATP synthase subunit gamma [Candidatus Roizmanbacteria bacterium]|nr:MAG: F0F1 ATP synthase subunit gamma [Candidatus Roizmanbacteria bacterium]